MGDTLITVIAIVLAAVLMFVFPLMTMGDRADDITQATVDAATREFVDNVCTKGKITPEDLTTFRQKINSTGYLYVVEIQVKVLDENPSKKSVQVSRDKIGENLYYTIYTTQVEEQLSSKGRINLKEGDIITVTVKNTNQTIAQLLRNFFYVITGNDSYQIVGQHTGIVAVNGSTSQR